MSSSDQAFSLSNRVQNTDHRVLGPAHYLQKRFCSPDLLFRRYFCPFPHPPHHRYQARTPYFPYIRLKSLQVPTPRHDDRLPHDTRGSRRCGMQGLQASAPDEGEEDAAGRDGVDAREAVCDRDGSHVARVEMDNDGWVGFAG
jgi:hypothetical protein